MATDDSPTYSLEKEDEAVTHFKHFIFTMAAMLETFYTEQQPGKEMSWGRHYCVNQVTFKRNMDSHVGNENSQMCYKLRRRDPLHAMRYFNAET